MTFNIEITATPDAEILAQIHKQCFSSGWDAAAMRELLSIAGTVAFCVEEKAFGLLRVLGAEAEILTLCVSTAFRGQGIAKNIIHAMLAYSKKHRVEKIFLEVREGNAAAIMMYTHAGFSLISRRKDYYAMGEGSYEPALILSQTL